MKHLAEDFKFNKTVWRPSYSYEPRFYNEYNDYITREHDGSYRYSVNGKMKIIKKKRDFIWALGEVIIRERY